METAFDDYTIDKYKQDIDLYGIKEVWDQILQYRDKHNDVVDILRSENFGELYEIGLAHANKESKKEFGKYYTPDDVATLLAEYLKDLIGSPVCDVCCGVGNLILKYLEVLGPEDAKKLLLSNQVYLYDIDPIAISICKFKIKEVYGNEVVDHIQCMCGDFLSSKIQLPAGCKVISNPPYFHMQECNVLWEVSDTIMNGRDMYAAFMEKIITTSNSSVMITPFSFTYGDKFYSLRKKLNKLNGIIHSFDNVPGNIFNGKKHGIFNTNTSNSVRVSVTIVENIPDTCGFKIGPLIRFQSSEREFIINRKNLEKLLPEERQIVTDDDSKYHKVFKSLLDIYHTWVQAADGRFNSLLSATKTEYKLSVPNTSRYYVSGTKLDLARDGKNVLYFKNYDTMCYAYCVLNSSFAYWWWRMFGGGTSYHIGLLKTIPIKFKTATAHDMELIRGAVEFISPKESEYVTYKLNAQKMQENVKFPKEFRDRFNEILLLNFGCPINPHVFDCVHANNITECMKEGDS